MTRNPLGKVPLTRHPLLPLVAALWCAAFAAIGGLAIGAAALENAVAALGLDRLIPAAAPPLGFTARVLVAGALGLGGALVGYGLARLAGRGRGDGAPAQIAPDPAFPPASVGEDEDLARLKAAREAAPLRRRPLTRENSETPPILRIDDLADLPPPDVLAQPEPAAEAKPEPQTPEPQFVESGVLESGAPEAGTLAPQPLAALALSALVDRFAAALRARAPRSRPTAEAATADEIAPALAAPAPQAEVLPEIVPEIVAQTVPETAPLDAARPFADPAPPEAPAPPSLDDSLRPFDMPPSLRAAGLGNVEWFDEAEEESTLQSLLPPKRPSGRDPFGAVTADPALAEEAARWALPEPDEEDGEAADTGFSSLLDMKSPVRAGAPGETPDSFVRVDEGRGAELPEPVVIFPGQATPPTPIPARLPGAPFGATPVETEAALRDALAALQKMSQTG